MTDDYVVHASIGYDLIDAHEELDEIMKLFVPHEKVDEGEFNSRMAHLYSHLNSAWNKRNITESQLELADGEQLNKWTAFPTDLMPL
ncbi:MAG TPA: hypothetical protein VGQ55_09905 [Pyrinomonadaceae bacterium]|jgi:hypothetical protein|nr:hypothetical protein [Pyrinomonadaceae bacterium]